ncbi:hypothetical protein NIASO_18920 [Niabella soli DSM 19437]|uniref:Uncharacterized protein n=1 Tax=Niabella soli DSM 19437 TaxID=929713 RepID=W0F972_9BACT|nr:hypothetical protein NIASO_18920 [Niabella soli DSM 19437]
MSFFPKAKMLNPFKLTRSNTEEIILLIVYIIVGCGLGFLIGCAIENMSF